MCTAHFGSSSHSGHCPALRHVLRDRWCHASHLQVVFGQFLRLAAANQGSVALSGLTGSALVDADRGAFLRRHFALYVFAPLGLLLAYIGKPVLNEQLGAIYLLAGFALAAHALHGIWMALDRLSDRRVAMLLGATLLALGLIIVPYHRTVQPTASDEPHYLIVMQSLVLDHDLDIANDYAGDRYLTYYPAKIDDIHGIHVGPAIYSIRDLGLVFLGAIPFAIGERTGVLAFICVAGGLLAH